MAQKEDDEEKKKSTIPIWVWILGVVIVAVVLLFVMFNVTKEVNKNETFETELKKTGKVSYDSPYRPYYDAGSRHNAQNSHLAGYIQGKNEGFIYGKQEGKQEGSRAGEKRIDDYYKKKYAVRDGMISYMTTGLTKKV